MNNSFTDYTQFGMCVMRTRFGSDMSSVDVLDAQRSPKSKSMCECPTAWHSVDSDLDADTEALEDEFEQDFQNRYFKKDSDGVSPYDADLLYHSEMFIEHSSKHRPMLRRFRKLSKDFHDKGLSKHRDKKIKSKVAKRLSTLETNLVEYIGHECEYSDIPKQTAKQILHKQSRIQLRQSLSHIHHLSDVPVVEKTTLDENPKKIRVEHYDYEVSCDHCHGYGCKYCVDGYDTVHVYSEVVIDPDDTHHTQYPYHNTRDRSKIHLFKDEKKPELVFDDDEDDNDDEDVFGKTRKKSLFFDDED